MQAEAHEDMKQSCDEAYQGWKRELLQIVKQLVQRQLAPFVSWGRQAAPGPLPQLITAPRQAKPAKHWSRLTCDETTVQLACIVRWHVTPWCIFALERRVYVFCCVRRSVLCVSVSNDSARRQATIVEPLAHAYAMETLVLSFVWGHMCSNNQFTSYKRGHCPSNCLFVSDMRTAQCRNNYAAENH